MSFLERVRNKITPIYHSIQFHPLNIELLGHRLEERIVTNYLSQTLFFLSELTGAVSLILAKTNYTSMVADLLRTIIDELENERKICDSILYNLDHQYNPYNQNVEVPACISYANFLLARAASEDIPVAISSILPRFLLSYHIIGAVIDSCDSSSSKYADLIRHYKADHFSIFIKKAEHLINDIARDQSPLIIQRMEEAFMHSSLLQWHFLQEIYYFDKEQFALWASNKGIEERLSLVSSSASSQ